MNAGGSILVGIAAAAGVAYALSRQQGGDSAAYDVPPQDYPEGDYGAGAAVEFGPGDWGPLAVIADSVRGVVMGQQTLSYAGLANLKNFEGFSATPYPDHKGYSIGYGHLIKPGEDLTYVTEEQGAELLAQDVGWAERAVRAVGVPLTQNQFDALVSLCFNIGETAFKGSTLVRLLVAGDYAGASAQFARWNKASGQVNNALVARRAQEQQIFEA